MLLESLTAPYILKLEPFHLHHRVKADECKFISLFTTADQSACF